MKYLFFDLEEATSENNSIRICEFGYAMVDENFSTVEKDNFIINPNINRNEWDYHVVRKILQRKIKEYESKPKFNHYYQKISNLILSADYIFGHSLQGDVIALNKECRRYDLPYINFIGYEIKEFYKKIKNIAQDVSVLNMLKALNIVGATPEHDAENDAYNTMLILQLLLAEAQVSVQSLIEQCPNAKLENKNFNIKTQSSNFITHNQPHASASIGQLLGSELAKLHINDKN